MHVTRFRASADQQLGVLRFMGATISGLMLGDVFCNKERIKNVKAADVFRGIRDLRLN